LECERVLNEITIILIQFFFFIKFGHSIEDVI